MTKLLYITMVFFIISSCNNRSNNSSEKDFVGGKRYDITDTSNSWQGEFKNMFGDSALDGHKAHVDSLRIKKSVVIPTN